MFTRHSLIGIGFILTLLVGLISSVAYRPVTIHAQNTKVLILVIDDFTGISMDQVAHAAADYEPGNWCYADPDFHLGQGVAVARGMGTGWQGLGQTHGAVVLDEIKNLTNGMSVSIDRVNIADAGGYTETAIAHELRHKVGDDSMRTFSYIIFNMSFALIPCEIYQDLLDLQNAFINGEDIEYPRFVFQEHYRQYLDDGTNHDLWQIVASQYNYIPVAAAGNYGFDFPLAPASWRRVISVSASSNTDSFFFGNADYFPLYFSPIISNSGYLLVPGWWSIPSHPDLIALGTSFAAPKVSALMALEVLSFSNPTCVDALINNSYGDSSNKSMVTVDGCLMLYVTTAPLDSIKVMSFNP